MTISWIKVSLQSRKSIGPTSNCCFDDEKVVSRFMNAHDEGRGRFVVKMPFMTHNFGRHFCELKGKQYF
jgi:hypothetical protein